MPWEGYIDLRSALGRERGVSRSPFAPSETVLTLGSNIRSIALTETFHEEDTVKLSEEDLKEVHRLTEDFELRRRDPGAYYAMLAKRSQASNVPVPPQQSRFFNVAGVGQALAHVMPTPLASEMPLKYSSYEAWRVDNQPWVDAFKTKWLPGHSTLPGTLLGASEPLVPTVGSMSIAGPATTDLQPAKNPHNVSEGQLPDSAAIQPISSQVRTDKIGFVNAQVGEPNSTSEEAPEADTNDLDAGSDSNVKSVPNNTANEQNPGTPRRTGTPTNNKPQNPTTPSKTTLGIPAQTTPGTPSRTSVSVPVLSRRSTTPVTADARRVLRSSSHAGSLSARESKQKRSNTPSAARACSTSFHSGFESLNDAFMSGSDSRQEAK